MSELNEVEINKRLLISAEEELKGKMERFDNINRAVRDLKKKLMQCADCGRWDDAQSTLEQVRKLSIDTIAAGGDVTASQGRVDALRMSIQRAEEAERVYAVKRDSYVPRESEPSDPVAPETEPKAEPEAEEADSAPKA